MVAGADLSSVPKRLRPCSCSSEFRLAIFLFVLISEMNHLYFFKIHINKVYIARLTKLGPVSLSSGCSRILLSVMVDFLWDGGIHAFLGLSSLN
jgi:hypothetical protein